MEDENKPAQSEQPPAATPPAEATGGGEGDSLESGAQQAAPTAGNDTAAAGTDPDGKDKPPKGPKKPGFFSRFSVYLLLFAVIIIIALIVVAATYFKAQNTGNKTNQPSSQTLTQGDISQLAQSDVSVGGAKQTLNVQSNAVFTGQVLVRSDLQVAGKLQVGGTLSLSNITVSGTSQLNDAQVGKNLTVAGNEALQGSLTVQKSLSVNGSASFKGAINAPQIATGSLLLNGELNVTKHITFGGPTPSRSAGSALGSGGSASVNGSDTAGSININTGGSPAAGCFVTVTFTSAFHSTPHVIISPVGAAAGKLNYYATRTTSGFSVCDASAPPGGASFAFDYLVTE
jgi:cytoskeletal protein CcmA (bactofilin family)